MAENELLDLPKHNSWRRTRQLLHSGADAAELIEEVSSTVGRILGKIPKSVVQELIDAAQAGDIRHLNEFIRENNGLKKEFAKQVRDACQCQSPPHSVVSLADMVGLIHRRYLDQFRGLMYDIGPTSGIELENIHSQLQARLQRDITRHVSALQSVRPSSIFPRPARAMRPHFRLDSSLLDKTLPPVRANYINESSHGSR